MIAARPAVLRLISMSHSQHSQFQIPNPQSLILELPPSSTATAARPSAAEPTEPAAEPAAAKSASAETSARPAAAAEWSDAARPAAPAAASPVSPAARRASTPAQQD